MSFPAVDAFGTGLAGDLTAAGAASLHNQVLAAARQLPGAVAASELTILSGAVTPTGAAHTVDTEGNASTDDLVKIDVSGVPNGHWLLLTAENTSRVVTIKTQAVGVGRILLDGSVDFVMDQDYKKIQLRRVGNNWQEVMRVTFPPSGAPHGRQEFTSSGDFTVPAGVSTVWVTMIGGGGGGGGGAGCNGDNPNTGGNGGNGGNGGATSFGSYASASGGSGGAGGNKLGPGGAGSDGFNLAGGEAVLHQAGYYGDGGAPLASPLPSYGHGGSGGKGGVGSVKGGGGGASGYVGGFEFRRPVTVVPGQVIAVTVGAAGTSGGAGTGSNTGVAGSAGAAGYALVEW